MPRHWMPSVKIPCHTCSSSGLAAKTLMAPGNAALLEILRSLPEVDSAQFDWQWAQRLHQIIEVFQRAVLIVAALFAGAVVLVVGNTIRMAVYSRRQEIEIHKLFGATDAFITRPFLYSGMLHGIAGSLLAWLMLEVSMMLLQGPVTRLADLYGSPVYAGSPERKRRVRTDIDRRRAGAGRLLVVG